jgi:exodeoxyribonuclease-3
VRIATWNVNALTVERMERIVGWLDIAQPDVLCLQETKASDNGFPALVFHARGYASVHHGEGRWNGVAILSRVGLDDPVSGFADGKPADDADRPGEEARPVAVCGDFNVARADIDVWSPAAFVGDTHVTPEERAAIDELEAYGLRDVFRERYQGVEGLYSWWDYRAGNFPNHKGMRIDLVLLSSDLADGVRWALIDRNARKGAKPSDHAPLFVDVDSPA